jgi:Domain of unknown function (DUF4418)
MRCHWTFQAEFPLALAALAVAGALWLFRAPEARRVVGLGLILVALLVLVVPLPGVIGLCGNSMMACHRTAHWIRLWAALLLAEGVCIAVLAVPKAAAAVVADPWESSAQPAPGGVKGEKSCCA